MIAVHHWRGTETAIPMPTEALTTGMSLLKLHSAYRHQQVYDTHVNFMRQHLERRSTMSACGSEMS
jgi:hypothetical protein